MSFLRVRLMVVLAIIASLITFLLLYNKLTDEDYLKGFVLGQLEQSLGRKFDVRHVKVALFPRLHLELSQVEVYDIGSEQVVLKAKRVDLVVRMLPLFRKHIVGKRVLIEEPTFTLRRDEAGRWNISGGLDGQEGGGRQAMESMARMVSIREAALINGTITVIDAARPDGIRAMTLEHVEVKLLIRPDRGVADLHVSAGLSGTQEVSAISLDGVLRQADRPQSLIGQASVESGLLLQFDGHLDAAAIDIREAADFFGPHPVPERFHGTLTLESAVQIRPGVAGYDVVLSQMSAQLNEILLTGKANLSGLMTTQPTFSVTFGSSLVSLAHLMQTLPAEWIHPQLPAVIKERQIDGKVQVMNATLTGSATGTMQLSTTGEFYVQEGRGLIGQDRIEAKDIVATVVVEPGRIRVSGLKGFYGAIELTGGKAVASFLEEGPWLELEIEGSMPASHLVDDLAKMMNTEQLSHALGGVRDVEGMVELNFRLVGSLTQPDGVSFAGGEIVVHSVAFNHTALPERLTGLQGRLVFAKGATQFERVIGHLGDTLIEAQGTITGGGKSVFQDFSIRASGTAAQMVRAMSVAVPPYALDGHIVAAVTISGTIATPHLRGAVVFDDSKIVIPSVGEKPIGAPLTVEFEGDVTKTNNVAVNRMVLHLPSFQVPAKGLLLFGEQFSIDVSVATGTVSLSGLPEWISKWGMEAGNLEVSLDIKGKGTDWNGWRITGWVALTNGLMALGGQGRESYLQDLYARVKLVRNGAEIKRLSFKIHDSDVAVEGAVRNWPLKPVIVGKIESNQLDLSLLLPQGERSPIREFLENLAATSQVRMSAEIGRGQYKHLRVQGISARVNVQDGVIDIDRIAAVAARGQVAGRLVAQLPRKAPAEVKLSFRVTGMPVDDVLRLVDAKDHGITGDVRFSGFLFWHGRNPHGISPSLNGKAEVLMENGHILQSSERAIWKIISLLNLPAVLQGKVDLEKEGLPYNKISGSVSATNGVFQTDNLIIDSPILKITAVGRYDLPTDQLDLVTAVSPFGSYAQFLKAIPLFGRILSGERKGLATAMFAIKGSARDPEVTYLPVKSFATGLSGLAQLAVDVLTNTLTIPLDLVTPDEEEEPQPAPQAESYRSDSAASR